jgi:hypothetical protein
MATDGIQAVYLEAHDRGNATRLFQSLGFEFEFDANLEGPGAR